MDLEKVSSTFADEEFLVVLNESLSAGLKGLRESERKYHIKFKLEFRLNETGNVQIHVVPEDQKLE